MKTVNKILSFILLLITYGFALLATYNNEYELLLLALILAKMDQIHSLLNKEK